VRSWAMLQALLRPQFTEVVLQGGVTEGGLG